MKRLLLFVLAIICSLNLMAQLEVKDGSFKEVPGFVNINTEKMYDDNDKPYAVLKIKTENISSKERHELNFGGDAQTFWEVEYRDGEVWLYISYYATFLKISHEELSSTEFHFPFDMRPKCGYEMTLVNKKSKVSDGWGSLKITTTPKDALITLNGTVMSNPYSNDMIQAGGYEIVATKDRYETTSEFIEVKKGENKVINIVMKSYMANITFKAYNDTEIYLDDNFLHRGTWTGQVLNGNHKVEYHRPYHRPVTELINVVAEESATYELYPIPIYAKISVTSEPSGADIYIDGKHVGVTPMSLTDIMIGPREVRIEKEKWKTEKKHFDVKEEDVLNIHEVMIECPDGFFSVSDTVKVYFSKGNLQYQTSTNTWRFADNQWNYIGNDNKNISIQNNTGWIDLFGWGTGDNPTNVSKGNYDYKSFVDWGYVIVSKGHSNWRTLTKNEWIYLFNIRSTKSKMRYVKAKVNGVNGIVLLPDNWHKRTYKLKKANKNNTRYDINLITASDWDNIFEPNGAVFLPAAGARYGDDVFDVGNCGYYWSRSSLGGNFAYYLHYNEKNINPETDDYRCKGSSVRLVCEVE